MTNDEILYACASQWGGKEPVLVSALKSNQRPLPAYGAYGDINEDDEADVGALSGLHRATERYPWLPFVVSRGKMIGEVGELAHNVHLPHPPPVERVEHVRKGPNGEYTSHRYRLPLQYAEPMHLTERCLLWLSQSLFDLFEKRFANKSLLLPLEQKMWRPPSSYGYTMEHGTARRARSSAMRAGAAFSALFAYTSYIIAMYEHRAEDVGQFWRGALLEQVEGASNKRAVSRAVLAGVGDRSRIDRMGVVLCSRSSSALELIPMFEQWNVPLYFEWGLPSQFKWYSDHPHALPTMVTQHFPSAAAIEQAVAEFEVIDRPRVAAWEERKRLEAERVKEIKAVLGAAPVQRPRTDDPLDARYELKYRALPRLSWQRPWRAMPYVAVNANQSPAVVDAGDAALTEWDAVGGAGGSIDDIKPTDAARSDGRAQPDRVRRVKASTTDVAKPAPLRWDIPKYVPSPVQNNYGLPPRSDQKPGEHPWAYFKRMRERWMRVVEKETEQGRLVRLQREKFAKKVEAPGRQGAEVYEWEQMSENVWVRNPVSRKYVEGVWTGWSQYHKKYDSVRDVWELWEGFDLVNKDSPDEEWEEMMGSEEDDLPNMQNRTSAPGSTSGEMSSGPSSGAAVVAGEEMDASPNVLHQAAPQVSSGDDGTSGTSAATPVTTARLVKDLQASRWFGRTRGDSLRVSGLMKEYAAAGSRQRLSDRYVVRNAAVGGY
jgi:hypothetical protein